MQYNKINTEYKRLNKFAQHVTDLRVNIFHHKIADLRISIIIAGLRMLSAALRAKGEGRQAKELAQQRAAELEKELKKQRKEKENRKFHLICSSPKNGPIFVPTSFIIWKNCMFTEQH